MFSLELECRPEEKDLLVAELWQQGSTGIVELQETRLCAFFEDGADVTRFDAYGPARRAVEQHDWVELSRSNWQPILVGSRFFIVPEWRADPTPAGRFRIEVNPGMAFGTGAHETTQLCLEALENYVRPGIAVLDVGAGSGILSRAAALLGAGRVCACDADAVAVEIARRDVPCAFVGSANAVATSSADLIVANISPEAIMSLAPELLRCLRPAGVALLSGFEKDEVPQIAARFGRAIQDVRYKNTWALLAGRV